MTMEKTTEQRLQEAREAVLIAVSKLHGITEQPFASSYWMSDTVQRLNQIADHIQSAAKRHRTA